MTYDSGAMYYEHARSNVNNIEPFSRLSEPQQKFIARLCEVVKHETLVNVRALARAQLYNRAVTGAYENPQALAIVDLLNAIDKLEA